MPGFNHQIGNLTLFKPWGVVPVGFGDNLQAVRRGGQGIIRTIEVGFRADVIVDGEKACSDITLNMLPGLDELWSNRRPWISSLAATAGQVKIHISFAFIKSLTKHARFKPTRMKLEIEHPPNSPLTIANKAALRKSLTIFLAGQGVRAVVLKDVRYASRGYSKETRLGPPIFGKLGSFTESRVIPVLNGKGEIVNLLFLYRDDSGTVRETDLITHHAKLGLNPPDQEVQDAFSILGHYDYRCQTRILRRTRIPGLTFMAAAECLAAEKAFREGLSADQEIEIYSLCLNTLGAVKGVIEWGKIPNVDRVESLPERQQRLVKLYPAQIYS